MRPLVLLFSALMTIGLGVSAQAQESFFYGLATNSNEAKKLEFEEWLRGRMTTTLKPFLGEASFYVNVNVAMKPDPRPILKREEVFLSKLDTNTVVVHAAGVAGTKRKTFFDRIHHIEIAIAHDGSISHDTLKSAKSLARGLVPLVTPWRVRVKDLKFNPLKHETAAPMIAQAPVPMVPAAPATPVAAAPPAEPVPAKIEFSPARLEVIVSAPEPKPVEARSIASNEGTVGGWFKDMQLLLAVIFGSCVLGGAWLFSGRRQGAKESPFDDGFTGAGRSNETHERGGTTSAASVTVKAEAPGSEFQDFAVGNFLPPEIVFQLPAEIMRSAFSNLSVDDKIGIIANLVGSMRAEYLRSVAPPGSKLEQFVNFELTRVQQDEARAARITQEKMTYLAAYVAACRDVIASNESFRVLMKPILDDWVKCNHRKDPRNVGAA